MAAPLQHITGVLNAMTIPLLVGATAVLAERWDADAAVADIMRHRVTYSAGATVFLQELTEAACAAGVHLPLRKFACGGAAVPRAVMERSEEQGIPASRVYGMTELPTVTVMNRAHPFDLRAETDGAIAPGVQVRVVGADGAPFGPSGLAQASYWCAGPSRCWATSTLRPTGRPSTTRDGSPPGMSAWSMAPATSPSPGDSKDVINRGGEKFSARDIEDLLITHPAVRHAAVVPGPDARFGEVPVAFVVGRPAGSGVGRRAGPPPAATGVARQKTPVAWHFVDASTDDSIRQGQEIRTGRHRENRRKAPMKIEQFRAMLTLADRRPRAGGCCPSPTPNVRTDLRRADHGPADRRRRAARFKQDGEVAADRVPPRRARRRTVVPRPGANPRRALDWDIVRAVGVAGRRSAPPGGGDRIGILVDQADDAIRLPVRPRRSRRSDGGQTRLTSQSFRVKRG